MRQPDYKLSYLKQKIQKEMEEEKFFVEKYAWGACSRTCKICGKYFICLNGRVSKEFCSEKCELENLKSYKCDSWRKSLDRFSIKLFWKFYAKYFQDLDEWYQNNKKACDEWRENNRRQYEEWKRQK